VLSVGHINKGRSTIFNYHSSIKYGYLKLNSAAPATS
jgi:hypothetical protein